MAAPLPVYPSVLSIPRAFIESYEHFEQYPTHLLPRSLDEQHDEELLDSYRARLEVRQQSDEPLLLRDNEVSLTQDPRYLPKFVIRDIVQDGSVLKKTVLGEDRLVRHLLGQPGAPQMGPAQVQMTKPDPRCRFV
jgi:hypothetical protein